MKNDKAQLSMIRRLVREHIEKLLEYTRQYNDEEAFGVPLREYTRQYNDEEVFGVPLREDGSPYEVTYKGKTGYVDKVDKEKGCLCVTGHDGTAFIIPINLPGKTQELDEESDASQQAKELGLHSIGFGRWIDSNGDYVADTMDGKLVKREPGEIEDAGFDPKLDKALTKMFDTAGEWNYTPKGAHHKAPGWNAGMEYHKQDIAYDANGEKTVQKLLDMVKDPRKLVAWLIKKFREETPNGKQRILQYLGILNDMGVLKAPERKAAAHPEQTPEKSQVTAPTETSKTRRKVTDLTEL